MTLEKLIETTQPLQVKGQGTWDITGIEIDSRRIKEGNAFVALRGTQADGHEYIGKALELGAKAVICETLPETLAEGVAYVQYPDTEEVVGRLATHFYGDPTQRMKLIGVTGTNGKTTIATLLYQMFRRFGYKCGLCSTVCNYIDGTPVPTEVTTPDPITLNRLLGQMADEGCEYAFMEVSSHSIVQNRIGGLNFAGGLFTNITRDHLDYHKTVEAYIKAKKMFFDGLGADAFALVNADDKVGSVMVQNCKAKHYTYSLRTLADFKAQVIEERLDGTTITLDGQELEVLFTGRFNVYNLASVYGAALLLGFDKSEVLVKISMLKPVSGRFQTMRSPRGYIAVVDYAHTPDALVNVLTAINDVVCGKGQVITVCGCGGDRDHGKRPMMAAEAANRSDQVILTSDNPRSEDPEEILRQMEAGLDDSNRSRVLKITDRREAIKVACRLAKKGDVVLVAGKGHETYQEIKGVKHHFDDREVLADIFNDEK